MPAIAFKLEALDRLGGGKDYQRDDNKPSKREIRRNSEVDEEELDPLIPVFDPETGKHALISLTLLNILA